MLQQDRDREQRAREYVRKVKKNAPWLRTKEGNRRLYRAQMEVESIDMLVDLALDGDKDALEILKRRTRGPWDHAHKLGLSVVDIPARVSELALETFFDGPPKAKHGSSPKDTGKKYLTIAMLVDKVSRDYGFPEYRNTEHRGKKTGPMSACLLVAQEMGLEERWVEEIWAERKEMIRRRRHSPH
jgi:hypothetical protein